LRGNNNNNKQGTTRKIQSLEQVGDRFSTAAAAAASTGTIDAADAADAADTNIKTDAAASDKKKILEFDEDLQVPVITQEDPHVDIGAEDIDLQKDEFDKMMRSKYGLGAKIQSDIMGLTDNPITGDPDFVDFTALNDEMREKYELEMQEVLEEKLEDSSLVIEEPDYYYGEEVEQVDPDFVDFTALNDEMREKYELEMQEVLEEKLEDSSLVIEDPDYYFGEEMEDYNMVLGHIPMMVDPALVDPDHYDYDEDLMFDEEMIQEEEEFEMEIKSKVEEIEMELEDSLFDEEMRMRYGIESKEFDDEPTAIMP
jgi:hypothetical protein